LDVNKKKEIKKEEDDTSSYDDKLDVVPSSSKSSFFPFKEVLKSLGPGMITGAANEDPTTVATYSQAGAQFGFGMLWLALFQYPMLAMFQEMCARIGLVTGGGLAAAIKNKYPKEEKQCYYICKAYSYRKYNKFRCRYRCHGSFCQTDISTPPSTTPAAGTSPSVTPPTAP
jgi:hypothetical protein